MQTDCRQHHPQDVFGFLDFNKHHGFWKDSLSLCEIEKERRAGKTCLNDWYHIGFCEAIHVCVFGLKLTFIPEKKVWRWKMKGITNEMKDLHDCCTPKVKEDLCNSSTVAFLTFFLDLEARTATNFWKRFALLSFPLLCFPFLFSLSLFPSSFPSLWS